jgi:cytochrome o ubiquinol oxidase subunit 1
MGATRRLDHYEISTGWQPLFIVAGIGALIIALGIFFQVLQLVVSIWKRREYRIGNDPWNGRTLEWSLPSPVPFYNFAVTPTVTQRDAFWEAKQVKKTKKPVYRPISLPKNSGLGLIIGGFSLIAGFAIIWHIWWLVVIGLIGVVVTVIWRAGDDETEYSLTAKQVEEYDRLHRTQEVYL